MIISKTNKSIPKDTIDPIVSDIKKDDRSFRKEENFYSSYHIPVSERPEKRLTSVYNDIVTKGITKLGLLGRSDLSVPYWMQIYEKGGGGHGFHMHFTGNEIISWVHFLRPTSKKCFYFIDSDGKQTYPHQHEGDFIMFPSWMMHGVDPNAEDEDRCVVSGNIILYKIDSPRLQSKSYPVNDNIILWETKKVDNMEKEESNK